MHGQKHLKKKKKPNKLNFIIIIIFFFQINNGCGEVRCPAHNMNLGMHIIDTIVHYMQYKYSLSTK
jgi:hypothetical protein